MKQLSSILAKRYAATLANTALFQGFSADEVAARLTDAMLAHYEAGQTLLAPGSTEHALGILLKGQAVVSKHSGKGILRVSELHEGALFGAASLFSGSESRVYPTHIHAKKSSTALLLTEENIRALIREDERFCNNFLCYLTGRIHFLTARIEGVIHPDTKERVLLYLASHAKDGTVTHGLTALAQALNISRATLYRALAVLEEEGSLTRAGKNMTIHFPT